MDFNFIFFEDLTQTRAFIYFPSSGVYTLGYCLACWLFWEEFHCVKYFPCLKQQNVGKSGGWGGAHSCLSWFPSNFAAVNVVTGRVWPVFSPAELYRAVRSFFSHLNFICHTIWGWTQNEWYLQVWTVIPVRYFLTIEWQFIYASHKGCVP